MAVIWLILTKHGIDGCLNDIITYTSLFKSLLTQILGAFMNFVININNVLPKHVIGCLNIVYTVLQMKKCICKYFWGILIILFCAAAYTLSVLQVLSCPASCYISPTLCITYFSFPTLSMTFDSISMKRIIKKW